LAAVLRRRGAVPCRADLDRGRRVGQREKTLQFPPIGFSLAWYQQIVADPGWRGALLTSVSIAAAAAALSVLTAFPLAWSQWRRYSKWASVVQAVGTAPFLLPP
jgi:putative spermidine/putrescine transport system permease protein